MSAKAGWLRDDCLKGLFPQPSDGDVVFLQHVNQTQCAAETPNKDVKIWKVQPQQRDDRVDSQTGQSTKNGGHDNDGCPGKNQMARSLEFQITLS
jgi:hypothetical protein